MFLSILGRNSDLKNVTICKRQKNHITAFVVLSFKLCTEYMKPHKLPTFYCTMTELNRQVCPPFTFIALHCPPPHVLSLQTLPQGYVEMFTCESAGWGLHAHCLCMSSVLQRGENMLAAKHQRCKLKVKKRQQKRPPTLMRQRGKNKIPS